MFGIGHLSAVRDSLRRWFISTVPRFTRKITSDELVIATRQLFSRGKLPDRLGNQSPWNNSMVKLRPLSSSSLLGNSSYNRRTTTSPISPALSPWYPVSSGTYLSPLQQKRNYIMPIIIPGGGNGPDGEEILIMLGLGLLGVLLNYIPSTGVKPLDEVICNIKHVLWVIGGLTVFLLFLAFCGLGILLVLGITLIYGVFIRPFTDNTTINTSRPYPNGYSGFYPGKRASRYFDDDPAGLPYPKK